MNYSIKRPYQFKRYARLVLVMFVVSVLNMSIQMPTHAAMQLMQYQAMDMSDASGMMDHSAMQGADMQDCDCPPALCESVDAQHNQLNASSSLITILDLLTFYPISIDIQVDIPHQLADISFQYHDWQYRQHTPPPLSFTNILLI